MDQKAMDHSRVQNVLLPVSLYCIAAKVATSHKEYIFSILHEI